MKILREQIRIKGDMNPEAKNPWSHMQEKITQES
jgi:hypothetical protein